MTLPYPLYGGLMNRIRWAHESHEVGFHTDTVRIRRTLPAIRKRDSDLEAQDLYSKFYR